MLKTHIIHFRELYRRKEYLNTVVKDAVWFDELDRNTIAKEILELYYKPNNKSEWVRRCDDLYKEVPPFREQTPGDLCCSLSHVEAWRAFSCDDESDDWGLFLEDDAILCDNFYEVLDNILQVIPECDAIFLGGGFPHTVAPTLNIRKAGKFQFIQKTHPATNCLCAYMLNKKTALGMYNYLMRHKIVLPIDFEVNFMFRELDTQVIHIDPMICREGSSVGVYSGSQER